MVLNNTDNYVFCYACGVRAWNFDVLNWNGTKFENVQLAKLPDSAPADLKKLTDQAVTQAESGFWKDAQATISQTLTLSEKDPTATWDAALIKLTAEQREQQAHSGAYPLLDNVLYGDYPAALDVLRQLTPEQIFDAKGPLIAGTTAEGFEDSLTHYITDTTTLALGAQPDLAAAHFLRGWGEYLSNPADAAVLADIEQATKLAPNEKLFSASLAYLKQHPSR